MRVRLASTHRQDFCLGDVPEALPEMDVQVLGNAFKLCTPQLRVDGVLPRGEDGAGCDTWGRLWRKINF